MDILITGGAGFIGSHLAERLVCSGHRVTALDDLSTGSRRNVAALDGSPLFELVVGDVCESDLVDDLVARAELVYHLAAAVGVELVVEDALSTIRTNVLGTEAVLKAAERSGVKVMLASTSEVYGKCASIPAAEADDVLLGPSQHSRWCYATSKYLDEFLALAYHRQRGLPVVIVRLFNTVGPRQTGRYGMVIPRFVRAALDGRPLPVYGDGRQSRTFCHVEDVLDALLTLTETPDAVGRVFNIGSAHEISIRDLAQRVLHVARVRDLPDPGVRFIPYEEAYAAGYEDVRRRVPDTSKLRALIGWHPHRSLDDILRDVFDDMDHLSTRHPVGA